MVILGITSRRTEPVAIARCVEKLFGEYGTTNMLVTIELRDRRADIYRKNMGMSFVHEAGELEQLCVIPNRERPCYKIIKMVKDIPSSVRRVFRGAIHIQKISECIGAKNESTREYDKEYGEDYSGNFNGQRSIFERGVDSILGARIFWRG